MTGSVATILDPPRIGSGIGIFHRSIWRSLAIARGGG